MTNLPECSGKKRQKISLCGLQKDRHGMEVWNAPLLAERYNHFVTAIHLFA